MASFTTAESGRRGYWRYLYGSHAWVPITDADWSRGMIRDAPKASIPSGGVYDASDFLLHQQGIAMKRGGTSYAGPALGGTATFARAVVYAEFPAGAQIVAVGDNGHVYTVASGTTTDLAGTTVDAWGERPKLRVGGGSNLLILCDTNGTLSPIKYDGSTAQTALGGSPPAGRFSEIYKSRLVLGNTNANPNRLYFSPTPDIESTWDTTNSWIDCDHAITGIAAIRNALLIFSAGHVERIIGSTPPPGSDMDRSPLGDVGTPDARSIVVQEGNCLFANPRGVYLTNGAGFASLTTEGQIESYYGSLFTGYDPSTWVISAGIYKSFYLLTIYDGSNYTTLMCNVPRRAWWRLTNIKAQMFAQAVGSADELYYADGGAARVTKLSGIFSPSSSNKNDADGTAVAPTLTSRTFAEGPGVKAWGDGHRT